MASNTSPVSRDCVSSLVPRYITDWYIAGDLLRAEQQRPGSTYGKMIKEYITEGKIVPMEVTVKVRKPTHASEVQCILMVFSYSRMLCERPSTALPHSLQTPPCQATGLLERVVS